MCVGVRLECQSFGNLVASWALFICLSYIYLKLPLFVVVFVIIITIADAGAGGAASCC